MNIYVIVYVCIHNNINPGRCILISAATMFCCHLVGKPLTICVVCNQGATSSIELQTQSLSHLPVCLFYHFGVYQWICADIMLKRCSACGNKHEPRYGSFCKYFKASVMASGSVEGAPKVPSRDDPAYISYLEGQLASASQPREPDPNLQLIMNRLDKLEISSATAARRLTVTTTSAPVFVSSPVTTMAGATGGIGAPTSTSWSAPWSAPPFHPWAPTQSALPVWNFPAPSTVSSTTAWPSSTPRVWVPPGFFPTGSIHPLVGARGPPVPVSLSGSTTTAAADIVSAPLTSALQQLSLAIEPTVSTSTQGIQLRPEYYIQHVDQGIAIKSLDHTKLSYRELICGMGRVLEFLVHSGSTEVGSYLIHMNFVTKQASVHSFCDIAYVSYDRSVVNQVVRGGSATFVAGDTLSVASHFHVGNMPQVNNNNKRQTGRERGYRGRRPGHADQDRESSVPEGFPVDLCYNYNYRSCSGSSCQKLHVCRQCRGSHRAQGCQERKDAPAKK